MEAALAVGIAIVAAIASGYIGYYVRAREFRREHRLTVYGEFVAAFLEAVHIGAGAISVYTSLGQQSFVSKEHEDVRTDLCTRWEAAFRAFENSAARVRLIASARARCACSRMEDFIRGNVLAVPPFIGGEPESSTWGSAAQVGPRGIDEGATRLAREFADEASSDVVPSRERTTQPRGAQVRRK